jgi:dTDP-glucose 4,6-dehydratase/UDP-glucose 4-epimerase
VRSLDNDSRGAQRRLGDVAASVEVVLGDIRDPEAVTKAARGMTRVLHLAYINGTEFFYTKPELVLEVAVKGMLNVLEACRENGIDELFLASSSEVYQTPPMVPTDETVGLSVPDPLNPRYSYGGGKIISELLAINYGRTAFQRVVIFRPHNVYGPDMGWEHVIPQLSVRVHDLAVATKGAIRLPIQGTGAETRAFCHVDDLVAGVLRLIDRGEHLGIYHVGTSEETRIDALAQEIGRCLGREVVVEPGPAPAGATMRRSPDITKLRALGYQPRITLRDGLPSTVRWYADHASQRPGRESGEHRG